MENLSAGQQKTLSVFFGNLSVAWFTAGIIVPYFSSLPSIQKLLFFFQGAIGAYILLKVSLTYAK